MCLFTHSLNFVYVLAIVTRKKTTLTFYVICTVDACTWELRGLNLNLHFKTNLYNIPWAEPIKFTPSLDFHPRFKPLYS